MCREAVYIYLHSQIMGLATPATSLLPCGWPRDLPAFLRWPRDPQCSLANGPGTSLLP